MINYEEILKANPNGVFATLEHQPSPQGEGSPLAGNKVRTRVFQYLFADGKKVYFCTNSEKSVYKQLVANPNVSFCTYPQNFTPVLSLNGKVVFVEDKALKARALDENPPIKGIYQTADNPIFKIFYIDVEEVETFSFAEGPNTYKV